MIMKKLLFLLAIKKLLFLSILQNIGDKTIQSSIIE